jgi:cell division protein ZapA (FtsZ GTPase activity inhibitor)
MDLSVAAAEDEVAYYREAVDRIDRKLERLREHVDQTKAARRTFVAALKATEDEVAAAKARDVEAAAGAAEGEGDV